MVEERPGKAYARTTPPGRRLAVSETAAELGISAEAVRSRLKRGTLQSVKEGATVYVLLPPDQTTPERDRADDQTTDRAQSDSSALISAKDETIATLKEQLEAERQAHSEARRIIAGLVERIPAIEAPQEPSGAAETVEEEQPERVEPRSAAGSPQAATQRRPWWRRVLGQRS